MANYTRPLPRDTGGAAMTGSPSPVLALARYASENATVSSVISVSHDTTAIEVATLGTGAAIRWIAAGSDSSSVITVAGSTSNFDHTIPPNAVRRFVIPVEVQATNAGSVVGINRGAGLYQRVAHRTLGIASVFLSEY